MSASRTLILGTAGHVDHGKTTLVRALTGTDTDRLEEEHRRGISIELGFAELSLGDDLSLGIVDVPGHERFVRQMVAGAGGMDLAMLLVASDEGVMPQTREHLDVLRLLGVQSGLVVLTKIDLADPDLADVVEAEVEELVEGTFLEGAPVVRVSASSGEGLDPLRETLRAVAQAAAVRPREGEFRLPVDRVFVLPGAGVVVTGTAWSGSLKAGDEVRLLPEDRKLRVREVQTHGRAVDVAHAGERVAVALHGVKRDEVQRGDQIVTGPAWRAASLMGVRVTAVGDEVLAARVRQRARLHVHHAAREVLGRIDLLEEGVQRLAAGQSAIARLVLEEPLVARPGDRIVLRTYSPMLTAAGAEVIDPTLPKGQRRRHTLARLEELRAGDDLDWALGSGEDSTAGVAASLVASRLSMMGHADPESVLSDGVQSGRLVRVGDAVFARTRLDALRDRAFELLREHQSAQPMSFGLGKEELRRALGFDAPAHVFQRVLQTWAEDAPVFVREDRVRADQPEPELDEAQLAALAELEGRIEAADPLYEATDAEMRDPRVRLLLDSGRAAHLGGRLLAHRRHLDRLRQRVGEHFATEDRLEISHVKDWTGASRKFVVPLMEWLDSAQITRFDGQQRRRGPHCPGA